MNEKPKALILDIETSQMLVSVWDLKEQYLRHNQIKKDWHLMAWGAKWFGAPEKEFMYFDQRAQRDVSNDRMALKKLWSLLDKADIIITQNGIKFDWPKLEARFMLNKFSPPSFFSHIDVYKELRKIGFTSHSLDYLTHKFCKKHQKLSHKNFPGDSLWDACLSGNIKAWEEMELYNRNDVLSLEELLLNTLKWMPKVKYKLENPIVNCPKCGSKQFWHNGKRSNTEGIYQRRICRLCGVCSYEKLSN